MKEKPKRSVFEIRSDRVIPAKGEVWVLCIEDIMNFVNVVRAVSKSSNCRINWRSADDVEDFSRYCLGILDVIKRDGQG